MNIDFKSRLISSTPVLDTVQYADGDQLCIANELVDALDDSGGTAKLLSIAVVDKAKQKSLLTVLLFNAAPTIASALNAALDITDAIMAANFIGQVSIPAANYVDLNGNSVATVNNINLMLKAGTGTSIWYVIMSGGTPTYGVGDLNLKFGIMQD